MDGPDDSARGQSAPRRRGRPPAIRPVARQIELSPLGCRRRREALGLTVPELARQAGLQEQTVQRFEAATVQPRPVTIVALHNALRRLEEGGDRLGA